MRIKFIAFVAFLLISGRIVLTCCHKDAPVQPQKPDDPCIDNEPAEDTTRVYLRQVIDVDGTVIQVDTLSIYPRAIFVRFYPWVTDTARIGQLIKKHHLRYATEYGVSGSYDQQLVTYLCVADNRRAEYHFTPYGKEGYCNFGADSLVEYAFGIFSEGWAWPTGNINFKFVDGTSEARIDSLFDANGLRLLSIQPDYSTANWYHTLVTPRSRKNVLDLGIELNAVPFVEYASIEMLGSGLRVDCDK